MPSGNTCESFESSGLYDIGAEDDFQWIDCSSPTGFTNWGPEQPDNYNDKEDCTLITSDWYWNDWDCDDKVTYLCEINANGELTQERATKLSIDIKVLKIYGYGGQ